LKGVPPKIIHYQIILHTIIPHVHQIKYQLNPNYAAIIKQDINKLFAIGFIKPIEETTWFVLIVVIPKNNGKLRIYIDFRKLNATTKKDPYRLPFMDEVINTIAG
jgi:hypothetical protein